jgi:hypothetical protein
VGVVTAEAEVADRGTFDRALPRRCRGDQGERCGGQGPGSPVQYSVPGR